MRKALLRWLVNALAVYLAARWVSGITVSGGWETYLWVALLLGLVNALIAPVIKFLTCPLILLSLGVFTLIINAAMLLLVDLLSQAVGLSFRVEGFGAAFIGAVIISVVSFVLSWVFGLGDDKERRDRRSRR